MNERQEFLLERYRELWTDLNATNAMIRELEDRARDIKAKQRQLANSIAKEENQEGTA